MRWRPFEWRRGAARSLPRLASPVQAEGSIDAEQNLITRRTIIATASVTGAVGLTALAGAGCSHAAPTTNSAAGQGLGIIPEAFGAVADGTTDCTAAFKAAIRAATADNVIAGRQRNKPVLLSAGVYLLTDTLTITSSDFVMTGPGGQNCALLFDHLSGDGITYVGPGDSQFRGFSIDSTDRRLAKGSGRGFASVPANTMLGKATSTLRLTVSDVFVLRQPGDGLALFNPEGLRLQNVTSSNNRGSGCVIDCSAFENICNALDFCRFRDNGQYGLRVDTVENSIFQRVECLNNQGPAQFALKGNYNTIVCPDCECFDILDATTPRIGLAVTGHGNIVQGGIFFKLSTAIKMNGSTNNQLVLPKFEGGRNQPMAIGVDLGPDCARNKVDVVEGNFVAMPVRDNGATNRVTLTRRSNPALRAKVASSVPGQYVPDLSAGQTLQVSAPTPCTIMPPVNAQAGDVFTLLIDSGSQGIGNIRFAEPYRGWSETFAAMARHRYATAIFMVAADGRCLPQSLLSYD